MRFLTKYSFFSNVFAIIIVVFGVLYIGTEALEGGKDPKQSSLDESIELTAYNFHYNGYDENGKLTTYFIAQKLEQFVNQNLQMTNIYEKNYDVKTGEVTWEFKSHHASTDKKPAGDIIHLYDGVNSIVYTENNSDKENLKEKSQDNYNPKKIHIITSEMYYDTGTKDFYNQKFLKIYDPKNGNNTTGLGSSGNTEKKTVLLSDDVRSYYAFG